MLRNKLIPHRLSACCRKPSLYLHNDHCMSEESLKLYLVHKKELICIEMLTKNNVSTKVALPV
uniref:Uncharacterized protein n=1 Tax=Piliocolobus tephrosceles TaxID=591936 RepID=A0A8C9LTF2_9PRIM